MSEEEIKAIENAEKFINNDEDNLFTHKDLQLILNLLSKKDKEYTELYDEFIAEKQLNVKRLDISNRLREVIDKMAEDLKTDYHSKEWIINYYMEKINEFRGSN